MLNNYQKYLNFIEKYKKAINASTGSEVDSNANVECKNVTTLTGELYKKEAIGINRLMMINKITELYGEDLAIEYIRQLESHEIYRHDETNPLLPYTYSSKESILVYYNDNPILLTFEDLYDLCNETEFLLDEEREVYAKYPENLYVKDKNSKTQITRLVKKKRHRDLVVVKTSNGENVIITDNHPMIISNNKNDTVQAINSLGEKQYRVGFSERCNTIDKLQWKTGIGYGSYKVHKERQINDYTNSEVILSKEFGYFVGLFIAEGWYSKNTKHEYDALLLKMKDDELLKKAASYLFNSTGVYSNIYPNKDNRGFYTLRVSSVPLVNLFIDELGISATAQQKKLPKNIFQYSDGFKIGMLCGLIDGDGTVKENGNTLIRLSSRACISQLSYLLNYFNLESSMTYMDYSDNPNVLIKSSYPMFGIAFNLDERFNISYKYQSNKTVKFSKYETNKWEEISKVDIIKNEYFLNDNEYIYDITTESNTFVLNNLWVHNCVSITMYPFLFNGLESIGGISEAPKNLQSFAGSFVNLIFAIASQFAGAVSSPEFLTYMDYFVRKEYGDDYYKFADKVVDLSNKARTIDNVIASVFQQVVYSLNQPAAARNFQSVFWNIAYFDKPYFEGIFDGFVFPDGDEPKWKSVSWLQKRFMNWLNDERLKKVITFPVETVNLLDDGTDYVDKEWKDFVGEMYAKGHSFFTYRSNSVDSLASCCRLRNEISDNTFSFTLGAGGVSTGSKGVITININRLVQNAIKNNEDISEKIKTQVEKIHKYLTAYNEIVKSNFNSRLLPVYEAGYISLEKQFLTIGINGFVEGAEFLGIDISPNEDYFNYGETILKPIYDANKQARTKEIMFNTEFVPAENLGVKNAAWDKKDGYVVPRPCYNSYFYIVEDETSNIIDKFILHGSRLTRYLDGGSALHANLNEHLSKEQYLKLIDNAIKTGCSYFTFNIPNTICNECGYISKNRLSKCENCGSENLDYITRIIGYLKRVSRFSEERQKEAKKRYYE